LTGPGLGPQSHISAHRDDEASGRGRSLELTLGTIAGLSLLIYGLMDTAKRADRTARRVERNSNPFADVTLTR